MKIYACPRCGSRNIFMGTMDSGVIIGLTSSKNVCRNCDYRGNPLIFDSEKEYTEFIKHLKNKPNVGDDKPHPKEKYTLSKRDKQVLDYVKDVDDICSQQEKIEEKQKQKDWWKEILFSSIIAILIGIYLYSSIIQMMGNEYGIIYIMGFTFLIFLSILLIFLVIEYIIKSFKHMLFKET